MRFLHLAISAAFSLSTIATASCKGGFLDTIQVPGDMIPLACHKGVTLAVNEVDKFQCWLIEKVCYGKGFKVTYPMVAKYIEPVFWDKRKGIFPYIWRKLGDMPLKLSEVKEIYHEIMDECVINNPTITKHPNFCNIKDGDLVLTKMANECIIPRVVPRMMLKVPMFIGWAKSHCHKVEGIVEDLFIKTKGGKEPKHILNPFKLVNGFCKAHYKTPCDPSFKSYKKLPFYD